MRYSQAEVRHRPTVIEAGLRIPSSSIVRITLDIDKAYLRYTDYPPDAMRGLDVPSGVLLVKGQQDRKHRHDRRLYTPSTLLDMPTPDFSMPYNVIIMTSKAARHKDWEQCGDGRLTPLRLSIRHCNGPLLWQRFQLAYQVLDDR